MKFFKRPFGQAKPSSHAFGAEPLVQRSAASCPPRNLAGVETSEWSTTSIGMMVCANGTVRSVHTDARPLGGEGCAPEEAPASPSSRELLTNGSFFRKKGGTKGVPSIIEASFRGDLVGVTEAIMRGEDVNTCIDMGNRNGRMLQGVSPLFLAAQRNHSQVCKLLVAKGADPAHSVSFEGSKEKCTPAQAATLHMHFSLAMFLAKAASVAKKQARKQKKGELPFDVSSPDQAPGHFNTPTSDADIPSFDAYAPLSYQPISRPPQGSAELDEGHMAVHDNPLRCKTNGRMDFDLSALYQEADQGSENSSDDAPSREGQPERKKIFFNVGFTLSGRRASASM